MTADSSARSRKPIEHRRPAEATIKQLYATAFRCGKPDCTKPLYRMNDETGELILNSRVAHIHARREGGPRWNPTMSEADNRSASNLIPLCLEHADEIDVAPQHYSAKLLREWKQAQFAEHQQVQKSWPLNDQETAEVVERSYSAHGFGAATAGAGAVLAAAREVGKFIETALQQRRAPQGVATAWRALRARYSASMPVYDSYGERLTVEPPRVEAARYAEGLQAALADAVAGIEPAAVALVAELHAVRAADDRLAPWCTWVERTTTNALAASGRWPAPGHIDDDQELTEALAELHRASTALSAVWRGEEAEQPPPPPMPAPEPAEDELQRAGREYRELLETARPWARVKHRPYDPELYARLVHATSYAVGLPRLPRLLPFDLDAAVRLAANVARNADDHTYAILINQAVELHPLAAAVSLLRHLMTVAEDTERQELSAKAKENMIRLLETETWQDPQVWAANEFHITMLLDLTALATSDNDVQLTIAAALHHNSDLLAHVLNGIAQWSEQCDSNDFKTLLGINRSIEHLPPWLPTQDVVAEIREQLPDLAPAADEDDDHHDADLHHLASHILKLAAGIS